MKNDHYFRQLDQAHERALSRRDEARERLARWRAAQCPADEQAREDAARKRDAAEGFDDG